ncbi:MAG: FAD-dependent oxidoreductase, partial [Acidisphaera sp.]|nr:FAD-dependent oxidoreductase [Acidisphaera sp.]
MPAARVAIIGAGIGGLAAAVSLATAGLDVQVFERAATPGGKLRQLEVGGAQLDAGPTVFTMRPVFEAMFAASGASLGDYLTLRPLEVLARHAWGPRERLDLYVDRARSADAIGAFAGPGAARGYLAFCERAGRVHDAMTASFMTVPRPSPMGLLASAGLRGLTAASPFATLWQALAEHFPDIRLRQLFGRYATYCGASPFAAPAILMLIAHVEQEGVWSVEGGMHAIAQAFAALLAARGGRLRAEAEVAEITAGSGRATGLVLADGERVAADAVLVNADVAALAAGRFGAAASGAVPGADRVERSLSAVTWAVRARADGFPLVRHNVFFSRDYQPEFDAIFRDRRLPAEPTVYLCAQDR